MPTQAENFSSGWRGSPPVARNVSSHDRRPPRVGRSTIPGGPFGDHGEADAIKAEERPGQAPSAEVADSHACKGLAVPA